MTNIEPPEVDTEEAIAPPSLESDAAAPFGYMIDPETGDRRPKKRPGRQRAAPAPPVPFTSQSPALDELKAAKPAPEPEDRSPDAPKPQPKGKRARTRRPAEPAKPLPPFREGPIAKGINRIYRKAGKIIKAFDPELGAAIISTTRKEDDEDTTVGEAWEEVARVNPRIRRLLLKCVETGTWSGLVAAHAPILLVILMKDKIRRFIPFNRLIGALLENDDDGTPSDVSEALGGIQPADLQQMMTMATQFMGQMGAGMPRSAGGAGTGPREPSIPDEGTEDAA